ncbi:HAD-IB family hydrolase [Seongchinamella sediminis]|uniref:1-acyl-sn-glycerol-3-phosphate acyltransferase n=1 Tax=Seongchinamella sediminis TaxID=2283635 RepID=A0A3L7E3V0_9GAMM|nr:HAD-IB family hydrolase [Seongchinamella sediminis]RLQ23032.1 HAD-IB family hydrolase [Seongchinamella sediminis]
MTSLESHLQTVANSPRHGSGRIAFFDLDRTLIAGYSILALAVETARHGAARGKLREAAGLLRDVARQKGAGKGPQYHQLVKRVAGALAGLPESTLQELGERAWNNSVARSLYREAISLVEAHRAAGDQLVIVSAASRYQVEPVARALGISEICCTRLEVQDGRFTGQVIAPLCYGEGKTMAARRMARKYRCALADSWFYGDSSADLPLLQKVGRPVAVNPSEKLALHARNRQWPQLQFDSRGMPQLENIARTLLVAESMIATTAFGAVSRRIGVNAKCNANRITRLLGDIGSGFAGLDVEIEGHDNLRRDRPCIYVFNHQSLLDSLVLAHLLREDVVALCKKEMADKPVLGQMLRLVDTIFVDRRETDQAEVLRQCLQTLASGRSLVIAPEGTRSTLGDIQPFKHGAFLLAKRAGVPIVPIVLHNVKDALPKGGLMLRPTTIRVTVMAPIAAGEIGSIRACCRELEERYCQLLGASDQAALPYIATA